MKIETAEFVSSCTTLDKCPISTFPEFAFIGRSNVGKSSLMNRITGVKGLAKTSQKPGKTQLINHFIINNRFHFVDLPGYGYAKVSQTMRAGFEKMITEYLLGRKNLVTTFVLLDGRLEPQKIDLEFMTWMGEKGLPFARVFTKADKLGNTKTQANIALHNRIMKSEWSALPPAFLTSAETGIGKEELLKYIGELLTEVKTK